MIYYVIHVKTNGEQKYIDSTKNVFNSLNKCIFWPRRKLRIRKMGKWHDSLVPIFPGYLFIAVTSIESELYWKLKKLPGFIRFLKDNHNIVPLPEKDSNILTSLLKFGEIVNKSIVSFDENNKIRIIEGPLKNLEGEIVKIDKRKGRAKVKLTLYEKSFLIDFGFQAIKKIKNHD